MRPDGGEEVLQSCIHFVVRDVLNCRLEVLSGHGACRLGGKKPYTTRRFYQNP
jgi:hypothetical protein